MSTFKKTFLICVKVETCRIMYRQIYMNEKIPHCLIKYHDMTACEGVEAQLHSF